MSTRRPFTSMCPWPTSWRACGRVAAQPARYSFKLEFPDGRWDLAEQELATEPRVGDLVWFEGSPWQIRGHRLVPRRPDPAHPHDFLACSPAA